MLMPNVQVRIHQMNNGKIEVSCKAIHQPHSRPYDTPAEAKATLVRLGVQEDVADAYLTQLQGGGWVDVGEHEIEEKTLKETGFTAV
jgi:hypothetical protein